jgi:ribosomal protein RSM22 (predicted rRNA methylase)
MVARFEAVEKDKMAEVLEKLVTAMMFEMLVLVTRGCPTSWERDARPRPLLTAPQS